jgi:hypothetical protein
MQSSDEERGSMINSPDPIGFPKHTELLERERESERERERSKNKSIHN